MSSRDETSKDNNGAEVELTEAELGAVAGGDLTSGGNGHYNGPANGQTAEQQGASLPPI